MNTNLCDKIVTLMVNFIELSRVGERLENPGKNEQVQNQSIDTTFKCLFFLDEYCCFSSPTIMFMCLQESVILPTLGFQYYIYGRTHAASPEGRACEDDHLGGLQSFSFFCSNYNPTVKVVSGLHLSVVDHSLYFYGLVV